VHSDAGNRESVDCDRDDAGGDGGDAGNRFISRPTVCTRTSERVLVARHERARDGTTVVVVERIRHINARPFALRDTCASATGLSFYWS
jgi:hypothetical protein